MIENNNHHLLSPDDAKRKWGRMPGSMAQLTALLSGLALSICAYFILHITVQNIVAQDYQRMVFETRHHVMTELQTLEQVVSMMGTVASYSGAQHDGSDQRFQNLANDLNRFQQIFTVDIQGQDDWRITDILRNDRSPISKPYINSLAHVILAKADTHEGVIIVTDPPGTKYWQESAEPVIKGQPFVLARVLPSEDGHRRVLAGVASVSTILGDNWLGHHTAVSNLVIRDAESRRHIYYMNRSANTSDETGLSGSSNRYGFDFGDDRWELDIVIGSTVMTDFLRKTPWVLLVFGLAMTLLGTLYVRNSQHHAHKISMVNRELAQKNYELNSEVSERERLNQVLRKAEREYRAIIDAVSDIIFETSTNGEVMFMNETWQKITGFDAEQVRGRNLFEMLHPQDQEEHRASFGQLVKGKRGAYRMFARLRIADGTFRSVELAMSMLRQDENRNMRVVGTLTDVEERRRAERALSEAEKKYRTIVENAAGGIYQVTPQGQFLSANPAMARILGYKAPEELLRKVHNVHDDIYLSVSEHTHFIRQLETEGAVYNFESQAKTSDGRTIWVNENARAVTDDEGHVLYYEGSLENITARKEAELSLKKAKTQSDLANRAKSEFLANMSHELRTPLNAIIGFAEIIKDEVLGPLDNRQYWDYANDIHESGQNLLTIINEILDVSRIEAGERQINESVIDLNKVIESCIDFMNQKAEDGKLKIKNMTAGKVPHIIGEELAVKQVLINLLGNAIKYTPAGGRITMTHEIEPAGSLRIAITDTGIGMETHEIQKALSPFGQLETELSRSGSGAGLGLTLVEALMSLHDGQLEIFSQKGIGTTVTIIFPQSRVRAAETADDDLSEEERRTGLDRRQRERRHHEDDEAAAKEEQDSENHDPGGSQLLH